jgi:hypothetical protein
VIKTIELPNSQYDRNVLPDMYGEILVLEHFRVRGISGVLLGHRGGFLAAELHDSMIRLISTIHRPRKATRAASCSAPCLPARSLPASSLLACQLAPYPPPHSLPTTSPRSRASMAGQGKSSAAAKQVSVKMKYIHSAAAKQVATGGRVWGWDTVGGEPSRAGEAAGQVHVERVPC